MSETKRDDGGPAFPVEVGMDGRGVQTNFNAGMATGLSIRDWFAGQALAGMMANENTPFSADHAEVEPSLIAEAVYEIADAMLATRRDT